ncbi:SOS response-associated peptidase [Paragemmobacter straminiformis]|uniref:Abasic site processing protein n=1 Tax=Paragemmobacter straminiformis TaxID=2045119 RepID=A0A842I416_9RHOB|nr:SOS response-associated peptidase [Gemmobacter straminiformis]MBC2834265.1 SOS response-associated peptidase [Gemmobacter straminiformis]
MCGRFTITHPNEALAALFDALPGNDLPPVPRYNVCPTTPVAVVTSEGGARRLRAMRWGFIPGWYKTPADGPLIINARSDTVAVKPAFREAVRARRCIVPASGFFEWQTEGKAKLPWYFTRSDGAPLAFAGLWQRWGEIDTVAIVSTDAGPGMAGLHHREAVVLEARDWPLWLGEAGHGAAVLMKPSAEGVLRCHRVDVAVNSNRAEGAQLIAPILA